MQGLELSCRCKLGSGLEGCLAVSHNGERALTMTQQSHSQDSPKTRENIHPNRLARSSFIHNSVYPYDRILLNNVLKTRQQAPDGVTYTKPHVAKPRLNSYPNNSFSLSQEWHLKLVNPELPVRSSAWWMTPTVPWRKVTCTHPIALCLCNFLVPPPSADNSPSLYSSLKLLLSAWCRLHDSWIFE